MQYFSYLDKRELLQQEYSQPSIHPSPHFQWVVKHSMNLNIEMGAENDLLCNNITLVGFVNLSVTLVFILINAKRVVQSSSPAQGKDLLNRLLYDMILYLNVTVVTMKSFQFIKA